jgi:hypothetical protein
MNRKEFVQRSLGCCALMAFLPESAEASPVPSGPAADDREQEFVQNWLTDLMETIEAELDEETRIRLVEGCGRGCFRRHQFKQDIAADGAGSVEKLIEVLHRNFEVWRADDGVHIRYGENSPGCYCPAARFRPGKPNDLHCHCSRMSHQTIWETALGHPVKVDILQAVRRGDPTCHFLVHVA